MTDKEKYDFIDHVVHLTIFVEDRLLDEHGGEYSGFEEDGIDSNEYYRIITERVIDILKKNNNYMQEEPVSIWHDSNEEQPEEYRTVVIWNPNTMDGEVITRCAEVYKGRIWAYIEDLLNLSNVQRTIKDWKEPVSENLEKEIDSYFAKWLQGASDDGCFNPDSQLVSIYDCHRIARHFANWQKEQFEKNRLASCDRQTEEEAEIEREFVTGIIEKEHRQPTFDDAIKYGMRLQKEEMMKNAISLKVKETFGKGNEVVWVIRPSKILDKKFNVGEKVKVIVIKED